MHVSGTTGELAPVASTLADELKRGTWDLHQRAEQHAFQRALVSGGLPRAGYIAYLQQMLHLHAGFEPSLREYVAARPDLAELVRDYQYQVPYLLADLASWGQAESISAAGAAVRGLLAEIELAARHTPAALLGVHYVLEGSKNGGRFIARAVRSAYALTGDEGVRFLDPYGSLQRDYWTAFRAALNALAFTETERAAMLAAARRTFGFAVELSDELQAGA